MTEPLIPFRSTLDIDEVIEASFFDFHVKGFDYICMHRSPERTIKLYFFDGDVTLLPEVVTPHDHRYAFTTKVVCGAVANRTYTTNRRHAARAWRPFQRFDYRTPLNGGDGFTWRATEELGLWRSDLYFADEQYGMEASQIHTIEICAPETALLLVQYEDEVPLDRPTSTWCAGKEPPSLSGLYRKPTADEVRAKLAWLAAKVPHYHLPVVL